MNCDASTPQSSAAFLIEPDDPRAPDVVRLLEIHLAYMQAQSPPEDVHALNVDGLVHDSISFFSARESNDEILLGVGALRTIDSTHGEIKSMHTAERARGRGVGRAIVRHLLDLAASRGMNRVSLETGTMAAFAPARRLYESFGFASCPPFGDYFDSPHSVCMTVEIDGRFRVGEGRP